GCLLRTFPQVRHRAVHVALPPRCLCGQQVHGGIVRPDRERTLQMVSRLGEVALLLCLEREPVVIPSPQLPNAVVARGAEQRQRPQQNQTPITAAKGHASNPGRAIRTGDFPPDYSSSVSCVGWV